MGLIINPYQIIPFNSGPTLPAFSNVAGSWGLYNLNPVGYPVGLAVDAFSSGDAYESAPLYTGTPPYALDWVDLISQFGPGVPPYSLVALPDQNSANDLLASGAARPTLQVTTPVVVMGIGAGTYTYRTQFSGFALYVLLGQPTGSADSSTPYALYNEGGDWMINDDAGNGLNPSNDDSAFPWQASWTGSTVSSGSGHGMVVFDGAATNLQGGSPLLNSNKGTVYVDFAPLNLVETGVILETGSGAAGIANRLSIRMVAGVLTASVYDATAIVALPNTKIKTLSTSDRIFVCVTWDTTLAAANQVQLYINNSQTGVTSAASADLGGATIGNGVPNVGSRNGGAAEGTFLTANMWSLEVLTVADDTSARLTQYNYNQYLKSLYVGPS